MAGTLYFCLYFVPVSLRVLVLLYLSVITKWLKRKTVSEPLSNTTTYTRLDNNDLIIVTRQALAQSSSISFLFGLPNIFSTCQIEFVSPEVYAKEGLFLKDWFLVMPSCHLLNRRCYVLDICSGKPTIPHRPTIFTWEKHLPIPCDCIRPGQNQDMFAR